MAEGDSDLQEQVPPEEQSECTEHVLLKKIKTSISVFNLCSLYIVLLKYDYNPYSPKEDAAFQITAMLYYLTLSKKK